MIRPLAAVALLKAAALALLAAEPIAVFHCRELLDRDWPRTLVTYQREFAAGIARPGDLRLVDAAGREQPVQVWRVKEHDDGSIASARISFFAELAKRSDYRFELQAAKASAAAGRPEVKLEAEFVTLDNGTRALRSSLRRRSRD